MIFNPWERGAGSGADNRLHFPQSSWLEEALTDVEPNTEVVRLSMAPMEPYFQITMQGMLGTTEVWGRTSLRDLLKRTIH